MGSFPNNAIDLIQQIQNFARLISKIFGDSSFIYFQNQELFQKLTRSRRQLASLFASLKEGFGFSFLHRVHVANQVFLQSCCTGSFDSIDFDSLRFESLMREIQMGTFPISHLFRPKKNKRQIDSDDESIQEQRHSKKRKNNRQQTQKG